MLHDRLIQAATYNWSAPRIPTQDLHHLALHGVTVYIKIRVHQCVLDKRYSTAATDQVRLLDLQCRK